MSEFQGVHGGQWQIGVTGDVAHASQVAGPAPSGEGGGGGLTIPGADGGGGIVIPVFDGGILVPLTLSSRQLSSALSHLVQTNPGLTQLVVDTGGADPDAVELLRDAAEDTGLRTDLDEHE